MPLFIKTAVNEEELKECLKTHWNVDLGAKIRDSQNQTFKGTRASGDVTTDVAIRVTPNPNGERAKYIDLELSVLEFLASKSLPVCPAIPALGSGALQVSMGGLSVSVFTWAKGELLDFVDGHWMTDEEKVVAVGRWLAKSHVLLDEYEDTHPELAKNTRNWDELHEGVLKGIPIDERDAKVEQEKPQNAKPRAYGLIHGDVNPSNYYWLQEESLPNMFDWDQLQRAWRLYDLTAIIWTVVTLQRAGSPVTMAPVPEADEEKFTNQIVSGYEAESKTKVDREELARMLQIRRSLYVIFCKRALDELEPGSFMHNFCNFMTKWLDRENEEMAQAKAANAHSK